MTLLTCNLRTDSPTSRLRSLDSQLTLPPFIRWPNFVGLGLFVFPVQLYVLISLQMIFNRQASSCLPSLTSAPTSHSRPLSPSFLDTPCQFITPAALLSYGSASGLQRWIVCFTQLPASYSQPGCV